MGLLAKDTPITQAQLHMAEQLDIKLVMQLPKVLAMQGWGHFRRIMALLKVIHILEGVNIVSLLSVLTGRQGLGEDVAALVHPGVLPKIQAGPSSIATIEKILGGLRCSYFTFRMA